MNKHELTILLLLTAFFVCAFLLGYNWETLTW